MAAEASSSAAIAYGELTVRDLQPADHAWATQLLGEHGGGVATVARLGELLEPLSLPGLVAERGGRPIGLATVHETADGGLEILTLHADPRGAGAGTALLNVAREVAAASGHHRLWLVTTNDNLAALHFYLRRGLHVARVHEGAVERDRRLKPNIPAVNGENGLPIRDLLELEASVDAPLPRRVAIPDMADLDLLPIEAVVAELAPLFEGGEPFLARLAAARPFGSDEALIGAARQVVRELPDDEAVALVNAHPRLGADPATVSAMSRREQGAGDANEAYDPDAQHVAEELAFLNEAYERVHGFRYTVFVAGRRLIDVIPLIEVGLRNDREAELRRALDDCVDIAADRLARLRAEAPPRPRQPAGAAEEIAEA